MKTLSALPTSLLLACAYLAASANSYAADAMKIPMTADRWDTVQTTTFTTDDSHPLGVMTVTRGVAVLKNFTFRNGTIEYDVLPNGPMGAGIGFRRRDDQTYEDFYLRPKPNCDKAEDCIQYAPQTHGVLLWDVFPQYQSPAPIDPEKPNHIKMVISGRRMNVYVNGATSPTLAVGRLEGDSLEGGILMQGPGTFANLVVTPDATEGLSPVPLPDPTGSDKRLVRNWLVSPSTALPDGKEPALAEMPADHQGWTPFRAERDGLIDLSRERGLPTGRTVRAVAWLKADLASNETQTKHVSIGWTREIWVFVNGKQVFADMNLYQPPAARKTPDGRLSLQNGSFDLPLVKGKNTVVIALANNFYGWGIKMRLDDTRGVTIPAAGQ